MEKYDLLSVVGEGSYGLVMRCRHRETGQHVAIKKFLETDDDITVKKMAMREIRMLRKLRHENLVNLIDVFRRKKRFFLVFEYVEHTVLEELEAHAGGLGFILSRKHIYQVLRALDFIHSQNVIHRDIKPENVLVSKLGVVKLCDFGFARNYDENETFTDYVATRWYRSPELLVGDTRYGKEVDIWAIGCLYAEMMTGEPLFPGDSDIDQLFQIVRVLGKPNCRHQLLISRNSMFKGMKQEQNSSLTTLFPDWNRDSLDFVTQCLKMDSSARPDTQTLLKHELFTRDEFLEYFLPELRAKINQEVQSNPLIKRMQNVDNNNVRKKSSGRPEDRKFDKHSSGIKRSNDETKQSKNKDKITQIGLSLLPQSQPQVTLNNLYNHSQSTSIKETQNLLRTNYSHSNENLNINNLTKKQILANMSNNKNNYQYFNSVEPSDKTNRISSAQKSHKQSLTKTSLFTHSFIHDPQTNSTSPVKFHSLQTENGNNDVSANLKILPDNQNSPNSTLPVPNNLLNYFSNPRKSLVTNSLLDPKNNSTNNNNNNKTSPIDLKLTSKSNLSRRDRGLPLNLGSSSIITATSTADTVKEADLRFLQPPPWLSNTHSKISSSEKVSQLGGKRMTDWKTMHNEMNRLSILNNDSDNILLPTCPGASSSPKSINRKKLTPIINSPEFQPTPSLNHLSN